MPGGAMLIDSHCHLDHNQFRIERDAVVERARAAGVGRMLTIGTTLAEFPRVLSAAESYPDVACTVGVHPHDAEAEADVTAARLAEIAVHPKVVGIGECGLDFFYDRSPRDVQAAVFRTHIAAARETGLPLVVHTRDADAEMAAILEEEQARGPFRGLLHCFSSGRALAETALRLGFYISLSGILTFPKSGDLRAIARDVPADRLLVETDAPYLAPVPMRGKRNEPAFVRHTAEALAAVRGETAERIAETTTKNFYRLFDRFPQA